MSTNHEEIEKDQYNKINSLTARVEGLTAAVDVSNQINIEMTRMLRKALSYEFWTIIVLIAVLIYGAIGEKGFRTVRDAVPFPYSSDDQQTSVIAPWNDQKIVPIKTQKS